MSMYSVALSINNLEIKTLEQRDRFAVQIALLIVTSCSDVQHDADIEFLN